MELTAAGCSSTKVDSLEYLLTPSSVRWGLAEAEAPKKSAGLADRDSHCFAAEKHFLKFVPAASFGCFGRKGCFATIVLEASSASLFLPVVLVDEHFARPARLLVG